MTPKTLSAAIAPISLLLALPAAGQNSQQPVIITPPVGDFDIRPKGATPAPTPAATPAPVPVQPIPLPTPAASRTPRAAQPATGRTRAPAAATPTPAATPAITGVTTGMAPLPTPSAVATAVPTEVVPADTTPAIAGTTPGWLWPALGGGLALVLAGGLGGWLLGRRRRGRGLRQAEVVVAPPAPASPPTPGPPPLSRQPAPTPRPSAPGVPAAPPVPPPAGTLVTELRPLRAAIRDGSIFIDFELFVQNRGKESADNIRAVLTLLGANAEQDAQIGQFQAAARMAAGSEAFSIAPGGVHMINGQVSVPGEQMAAVTVQGKPMFVPIVPVALRWYAGLSIRTLRDAFMIGTVPAPGSDKLGPLWVERAASGFGRLAAKRYAPKQPG